MPDASLAALALRLAVSMGVVIALMVLAAKVLKRAQAYAATSGSGRAPGGSGRSAAGRSGRRTPRVTRLPIEVQTIAPLGRGASIALVRAAGQELVVGITEQQVTLLHAGPELLELGPDPELEGDADGWDAALSELSLTELPELDEAAYDADLTPSPGAARIAALAPTSPGGSSAWTVALETLRARTVRR